STGIWWPTAALRPYCRSHSAVAWGLIEPEPPTLEHREGEYVHYRIISEFYAEFVDGQWVFPDDIVRGIESGGLNPAIMAGVLEQATEVISHGFLTGTVQPPEPTTYGF